jgi:hypothetical protein
MGNKLLMKIKKRAGLSCNWVIKFSTKTLIIFFLFVLILVVTTSYAAEDNWVYINEREDDLWFVNNDSITCKGHICRAWVKINPLAEKYEYTMHLNEYNCVEMKYRTLRVTEYKPPSTAIKGIESEGKGWNNIVPESIMRELYDFVCKKATIEKEQLNTDENKAEQLSEKKLIRKNEAENQNSIVRDRKEASLQPHEPTKTIFTVQLGAFKNVFYAKAFMAWFKEKGYSAYLTLSEPKDGEKLYKVCIGKFIEREKAQTLSEKIRNSEGFQTFVTSLPP